MISKVFIDANVLMEIMFARPKMGQVSELLHDPDYEFFISSLTVHIMYYFAEAGGIKRDFVRSLVDLAAHLPVDARMIQMAQKRYSGKDFEDCLQAACAELGNCDQVITLDKKFKKLSGTKLPVQVVK